MRQVVVTDALLEEWRQRAADGVAISGCTGQILTVMMPDMSDEDQKVLEDVSWKPELEDRAAAIVARRKQALDEAKMLLHRRYLERRSKTERVFDLEEDDSDE